MSNEEAVADFDWDSDVEDFPSAEIEGNENDEVSNERAEEAEDNVSEVSGKEVGEKSEQVADEVESSKEKDSGGEQESTEKSESSEITNLSELKDEDVISVKVDGELQDISIKEFKNGISGEKAIAKRFSEFDVKEKAHKDEMDSVNKYINTFAEKLQSGEPVAALEYLAEFSSIPAYEVKDMLVKALAPEIDRRLGLTDEELGMEKNHAKLKFDQNKMETEKKNLDGEQARRDLEFKVGSARQTHNISEDAWNEAFKHLDTTLPASEQITIETVKEYVLFSRAEGALNQIDANLISDKVVMDNFVDIQLKNPDFTDEDLLYIAKDAFIVNNQEQAKEGLQDAISNKADKGKPAKKVLNQTEISPIIKGGEEIDDWDDLL